MQRGDFPPGESRANCGRDSQRRAHRALGCPPGRAGSRLRRGSAPRFTSRRQPPESINRPTKPGRLFCGHIPRRLFRLCLTASGCDVLQAASTLTEDGPKLSLREPPAVASGEPVLRGAEPANGLPDAEKTVFLEIGVIDPQGKASSQDRPQALHLPEQFGGCGPTRPPAARRPSGGTRAAWADSSPQSALGVRLQLSGVGRARRHACARGAHVDGGICRHR